MPGRAVENGAGTGGHDTAPGVRPETVLLVASIGVFMAYVDATIANIAIPNIAHSFPDAHVSGLSWVLNLYNIVLAALLVPAGRLADALGRKRFFAGALVLFTLSSGACATAPSLGLLIAARAVQAVGAAALIPTSIAIIMHAFPPERRPHAVAMSVAVAALGGGIGPALGGALISADDWRLAFLINVPIGLGRPPDAAILVALVLAAGFAGMTART